MFWRFLSTLFVLFVSSFERHYNSVQHLMTNRMLKHSYDSVICSCLYQGDVGPVGAAGPMGMKGEQGDKGEKVGNDGRMYFLLLACSILAGMWESFGCWWFRAQGSPGFGIPGQRGPKGENGERVKNHLTLIIEKHKSFLFFLKCWFFL